MQSPKVILKFDEVCSSDSYTLSRLIGTLPVESAIKLLDAADLKANPREAKKGPITSDIQESIEQTFELFQFKSKGILLAAGECIPRDRKRYELHFSDHEIEGVLDGGHNLLALGLYLLGQVDDDDINRACSKVKTWEDIMPIWQEYGAFVSDIKEELPRFYVPIEVIYPKSGPEGRDAFEFAILDIAQARNNNAQLTVETKANKAGFYDFLKEAMDQNLVGEVEWKTNDGGRIKARDIVSLAWIPLSRVTGALPGVSDINPVAIYRNKGLCVTAYDKLMKSDKVTKKTKGEIRELQNPMVKNALKLMADIPQLSDLIYEMFPDAYNSASSGFGRISSVRLYDPEKYKQDKKKYMRRAPHTKYYRKEVKYDYPDGFIAPIVWGLTELIETEGDTVRWKTDPEKFLRKNINEILKVYYGIVQMAGYDPQKVGKTMASYQLAANEFRSRL